MSRQIRKYKYYLFAVGITILSVISIIKPEYAEEVARAFVLLFGVW